MSDNDTPRNAHASPPPPPPPPPGYYSQPVAPPAKTGRSWGRRILGGLLVSLLLVSIAINVYLGILVSVLTAEPLQTTIVERGNPAEQLAVFHLDAMIDDEQAALFRAFTRKLLQDDTAQAVVVRVNSPGGGVAASDQIHQDVRRLRDAGLPVVVSMGGLAASGGYYVSAPASVIFAEPTTVTGSIGVIAMYPVLTGTLDKLGMEMVMLRSTPAQEWKARPNPFETPSEGELANMRELLDTMHRQFVDVIVKGRSSVLSPEQVAELATGQVWLGPEAKELGLVDTVGYLDDALAEAARLAGLSKPHIVRYRPRKGLLGGVGVNSGLTIDAKLVEQIQTPRIMLLWRMAN